VSRLLSIGEFARATHLSVKALRHYHDVGVLEPVLVDRATGYRFYAIAQVPAAHVVRRLRDLDMPLDEVRAVLAAPDVASRDDVIAAHLERMERQLARTQATVASLRGLLDGTNADLAVEYRHVGASPALAIRDEVAWDDTEPWLADALEELRGVLGARGVARAGPDSAMYPAEYFDAHVGELVAYIPTLGLPGRPSGRVHSTELPGARVAVAVHRGAFEDLDETYGALGTFVVERSIGADGPIREHYLDDTTTEVCWPVLEIPS
jgi:DNA-binding transcriptional MerR regulator